MANRDLPNSTLQDLLASKGTDGGFGEIKIRRSRDFQFYGITQARTGNPEMTLSLKVIKSSKKQIVIPYHDISTPITYNGRNKIELSASTIHLTIEGSGLDKILDYLAEHRLMWIKEPEDTADSFHSSDDDENNVIINSIEVKSVH